AHEPFIGKVLEHAVGPDLCIRVDAIALLDEPLRLRRSDDASIFSEHAAARYTSSLILDAESRLIAAATTFGQLTPVLPLIADAALARFEAECGPLDQGQRALALAFATDPHQVS